MLRKHNKLTKKEMKKDPFVIFVAQAVDYVRHEWIKIGSIVFSVILIITISLLVVGGNRKSAINAYDVALSALENNAPEALDILENLVEDHSKSQGAADALIHLGYTYFETKDYEASEKYFTQYIKTFKNDPVYTMTAYNGLGGVYEETGEYSKAGKIYEEFAAKNKNSVFLTVMYLNAGKAFIHAGDIEAAKRNLTQITSNFIDSKEKQEAEFYLETLN